MKQKFTLLITAAFFAGALNLAGQSSTLVNGENLNCGTDQIMRQVFIDHPEIKADFEAREAQEEARDLIDFQNGYRTVNANRTNSSSTQTAPLYIIPIVFHIIHDYGSENISDAQVLDAVRILNIDYRKLNADTSVTSTTFQPIAVDAQIEFRLANIDPNGNCTNGIEHIASPETYVGDDGSKLSYWPRNKYLNIWVTKVIGQAGAAAYAYLPGTAPSASTDGVISLSSYVGSIGTSSTSHMRTLTHEIGHFLNLQHTWGSTNNPGVSCGNDGVTDTPVTKGWTSCVLTAANHVCNASIEENVQNYMEYAYCSTMFTAGQKTRMFAALNSGSGQRNQLSTTSNWAATGINNSPPNVCAPKADFIPNEKTFICVGSSVIFHDVSSIGHPTSWNWSFPGGTPSTSTDSIPNIVYNTAGNYAVTLTATNSAGSNTLTRTSLISVSSSTATYNSWTYVEGMENATTFASDYTILNPQGNGWTRVTTAAATGAASLKLANTTSMLGTIDEFVTPSINMGSISSPVFTFKVAYRQRTSTDNDRLRIYSSTNCGQTWTQRYSKVGTTLSTGAATTSSTYLPGSSEWRTETVSVSSFSTAPNVRFKFTFESDGGNNIFIDDINIAGANGIDAPDAGIQHFDVFPNPVQDNSTVSFALDHSENVSLQLFDMTGRVVMNLYQGELNSGEHQFPILTAEGLRSGMYFVRLTTSEGRTVTQKMIVQ